MIIIFLLIFIFLFELVSPIPRMKAGHFHLIAADSPLFANCPKEYPQTLSCWNDWTWVPVRTYLLQTRRFGHGRCCPGRKCFWIFRLKTSCSWGSDISQLHFGLDSYDFALASRFHSIFHIGRQNWFVNCFFSKCLTLANCTHILTK